MCSFWPHLEYSSSRWPIGLCSHHFNLNPQEPQSLSGSPNFSWPQRHKDFASAATVLTKQPWFIERLFDEQQWKHSPLCSPVQIESSWTNQICLWVLPGLCHQPDSPYQRERGVRKEHILSGFCMPDFSVWSACEGRFHLLYMYPILITPLPFSLSPTGSRPVNPGDLLRGL